MNNLTTRKIILGLMMAFVLALGVQGIAEAVNDPTITVNTVSDILTLRKVHGIATVSAPSSYTTNHPTKESVSITKK